MLRPLLLLAMSSLIAGTLTAQDPGSLARRVASTATLAAQEYALGVQDGRVVLRPEVEEAVLFLEEARRLAATLPEPVGPAMAGRLGGVLIQVAAVAPPGDVTAAVDGILQDLAAALQVSLEEIPEFAPSRAVGAEVYRQQCSSCHGSAGRGDGPAGVGLDPAPPDLTRFEDLRGTSPLDFFRRISSGTPGTAMPAFEPSLSVEERWAVAVYASDLRQAGPAGTVPPALQRFPATARMSDDEVLAALGPTGTAGQLAAVRAFQIAAGADRAALVLRAVQEEVDSAVALAARGERDAARQAAFDAYLRFEQVEREVRARRPDLAARLEGEFAELRTAVVTPAADLAPVRDRLEAGLADARRTLAETASPAQLFTQSFVILLREGLEAILILGAILAFLARTGASHRRREIHLGALGALAASLVTAVLIETIFRLSPARQELLEGFTMVAAAGMLFYVSYWLLSKMEAARWSGFVRGQVRNALTGGSTFALASVAFLAVYREGFETVLFYKALWVLAGGPGGLLPIASGMLAASVVLVGVYLAIHRFGVRLPLRPLFAVTSAFLYYMAVVFAGEAIAELQEGGLVGTTPVPGVPRIPVLGVHPTMETLLAQAVLVVAALIALGYTFGIAPRRSRAAEAAAAQAETAGPRGARPLAPQPDPGLRTE